MPVYKLSKKAGGFDNLFPEEFLIRGLEHLLKPLKVKFEKKVLAGGRTTIYDSPGWSAVIINRRGWKTLRLYVPEGFYAFESTDYEGTLRVCTQKQIKANTQFKRVISRLDRGHKEYLKWRKQYPPNPWGSWGDPHDVNLGPLGGHMTREDYEAHQERLCQLAADLNK